MATQKEITALIREIRTAFNRLKSVAETLHSDLEINPSMRAVLEALVQEAPQTVPAIASRRGVSRQHVQKVMNALVEKGLVLSEGNPDHKRSDLYRPTAAGQRIFAQISAREAEPLAVMADALTSADAGTATDILARLNDVIQKTTRNGD